MHVECRQRVIEDQDLWSGDDGPRQSDTLTLAAGQGHTLFADSGVEPPRQVIDERGLGDFEAFADLGFGGIGTSERDVLAGTHAEQGRLFESCSHGRAERGQGQFADVDAVDEDPAHRDVAKAGNQGGQRGLARTGRTHDRQGLSGGDVQVDVVQDRCVRIGERKADAFESHVPAGIFNDPITAEDDLSHSVLGQQFVEVRAVECSPRLLGHEEIGRLLIEFGHEFGPVGVPFTCRHRGLRTSGRSADDADEHDRKAFCTKGAGKGCGLFEDTVYGMGEFAAGDPFLQIGKDQG